MQVSLPNPVASLVLEVPSLEELPFYTSKAEAGVKLLREVKLQLGKGPKNRELKHLIDMKLLKPALTKEFNQYVPFMYIYHRYSLASKLFPSLLDKNEKSAS